MASCEEKKWNPIRNRGKQRCAKWRGAAIKILLGKIVQFKKKPERKKGYQRAQNKLSRLLLRGGSYLTPPLSNVQG